jgi:hypothetical protein
MRHIRYGLEFIANNDINCSIHTIAVARISQTVTSRLLALENAIRKRQRSFLNKGGVDNGCLVTAMTWHDSRAII